VSRTFRPRTRHVVENRLQLPSARGNATHLRWSPRTRADGPALAGTRFPLVHRDRPRPSPVSWTASRSRCVRRGVPEDPCMTPDGGRRHRHPSPDRIQVVVALYFGRLTYRSAENGLFHPYAGRSTFWPSASPGLSFSVWFLWIFRFIAACIGGRVHPRSTPRSTSLIRPRFRGRLTSPFSTARYWPANMIAPDRHLFPASNVTSCRRTVAGGSASSSAGARPFHSSTCAGTSRRVRAWLMTHCRLDEAPRSGPSTRSEVTCAPGRGATSVSAEKAMFDRGGRPRTLGFLP